MIVETKKENLIWDKKISDIRIGSSTEIELLENSVDLVLTSPPYCTRIDYGIAILPELALFSVDVDEECDAIRRSLMRTTTVPKTIEFSDNLGTQSYYKEIHCNLPEILSEMAYGVGFKLIDNIMFRSKQNMVNVNTKSKNYRSKNIAIESVLVFKNEKLHEQ